MQKRTVSRTENEGENQNGKEIQNTKVSSTCQVNLEFTEKKTKINCILNFVLKLTKQSIDSNIEIAPKNCQVYDIIISTSLTLF